MTTDVTLGGRSEIEQQWSALQVIYAAVCDLRYQIDPAYRNDVDADARSYSPRILRSRSLVNVELAQNFASATAAMITDATRQPCLRPTAAPTINHHLTSALAAAETLSDHLAHLEVLLVPVDRIWFTSQRLLNHMHAAIESCGSR